MTTRANRLKDILNTESHDDATKPCFETEPLEDVQKELQALKAENEELRNLNDNTEVKMKSLALNLQALGNNVLIKNNDEKEMLNNTVQLLEQTVYNQKCELTGQANGIQQLLEQKETLQTQIKCLEDGNEEKLRKIENLTEKYAEQELDNVEHWKVRYSKLQEICKHLQKELDEQLQREICLSGKLEEALFVAESAIAERDEKDKECKRLSYAFEALMNEAARKMEKKVLSEKRKYEHKKMNLKNENEKLIDTCENLNKYMEIMSTRCDRYEDKCKVAIAETARLTNELCTALGDVEDLKTKVKKRDKIISEGKRTERRKEHEEAIKNSNKSPKSLYDRYEAIIADYNRSLAEEESELQEIIPQ